MRLSCMAAALCIAFGTLAMGQTSFWTPSTSGTPATADTDRSSVTLGLQFYSDVPGTVTAVRFYKASSNTGQHIGSIWSSSGTKLGEVIFSGETASGWQQANFSSPISITANTRYVIAYTAPVGRYSYTYRYLWSAQNSTPLHVSDSSPGVYTYGSSSRFPTSSWNSSNYWVDVVFKPTSSGSGSTTYSISGNVSGTTASVTLSGASSGSTTTTSSGNFTFSNLKSGTYIIAPSKAGYAFTPATRSVSINGASITGVNFVGSLVQTPTPTPTPIDHSVSLSWNESTSPNIRGYNVYRGTVSGGPYTKMNGSLLTVTAFVDENVASGQTYFYVATAVDANNTESNYSNQTIAQVPTP